MPWKDASLISLRLEFVTLASADGACVRELCRRYGVSPKAAYKWIARFREGGTAALADRPRRPANSPGRAPESVEAEVLQGRTIDDLDDSQRRFDPWRESYNHERPHEALGLAVPASRYRPSGRPFPEATPEWEYGPTDVVRKVCAAGAISFKGRLHDLGKAFRGEQVAVRPTVEDGVFGVYFGVHQIARIDLHV